MRWIRSHPKLATPIAVALVGVLAWLVFGFFGFHLLFVDDTVAEAQPVFSPVATTTPPTATPAPAPAPVAASASPTPDPVGSTTPATTTTAAPLVVTTSHRGSFVSRDHPTVGDALVLGVGGPERFLRFEGFETDNGPDLNVYLVNSSAGGVDDFVDLGDLKGNVGDQNYEIPPEVDLARYDTVIVWCVRFSSPFGEAPLTAV